MGALTIVYFCPGTTYRCVPRIGKHYDNYYKESFFSIINNVPSKNKTTLPPTQKKKNTRFFWIYPFYKPPGNMLTVYLWGQEEEDSQHETSTLRGSWNIVVKLQDSEAKMPGSKCLALLLKVSCHWLWGSLCCEASDNPDFISLMHPPRQKPLGPYNKPCT